MRLAVVIPSFNHAHYIGTALESVLGQTRKPERIIVIDDGSTDGSPAFLEQFKSRGVEVLARHNEGAHFTINQAVAMGSEDCELISILNSDDHYHLRRFETLVPRLESRPDKSVIVSAIQVIDPTDAPLPAAEPRAKWFNAIWSWKDKPDADHCEWLGMGNFIATTSNVIARREHLAKFPFRPYRYNHDYYFFAQTVLRNQLLVDPTPLVNYRVHQTNTMNTKPIFLMREMVRMHLDLLHDLAPELPSDPALRACLSRYLRSAWDNVSALPMNVLQMLMTAATGRMSEAEIESITAGLSEEQWPELTEFPNKGLVNSHDGISPLGPESGLSEKLAAARAERKTAKENEQAWKELAKLQEKLASSKWIAFRRLLGAKFTAEGKSPQEKLAALRKAVEGRH